MMFSWCAKNAFFKYCILASTVEDFHDFQGRPESKILIISKVVWQKQGGAVTPGRTKGTTSHGHGSPPLSCGANPSTPCRGTSGNGSEKWKSIVSQGTCVKSRCYHLAQKVTSFFNFCSTYKQKRYFSIWRHSTRFGKYVENGGRLRFINIEFRRRRIAKIEVLGAPIQVLKLDFGQQQKRYFWKGQKMQSLKKRWYL